MNTDSFDIVTIGDTVIDAFIKISLGHIQETANGVEYCLPFGTKIPYDSVTVIPAVGNSANAAVSASRLGLKTAIVTFLGNDTNGKDCIEKFEKEKISTQFITQEEGKKTNYHYVLWHGDDRTILIKHEEFTSKLPDIGKPKWIYLSSLGEHTLPLHGEIADYLEKNKEVKLAFQPGSFQIKLGKDALSRIYSRADVFCANKEEVEQILGIQSDDFKVLLDGMHALGPRIVLITDGPHGAYMKNENEYYEPLYPDIAPPLDRTGAGDAFSSTFVSYLILGKTPEEAIMCAPINSMSVEQYIGAQEGLLTQEQIEEYLKKAPENYKLKTLDNRQ